jgi:hypothetical protein
MHREQDATIPGRVQLMPYTVDIHPEVFCAALLVLMLL